MELVRAFRIEAEIRAWGRILVLGIGISFLNTVIHSTKCISSQFPYDAGNIKYAYTSQQAISLGCIGPIL